MLFEPQVVGGWSCLTIFLLDFHYRQHPGDQGQALDVALEIGLLIWENLIY